MRYEFTKERVFITQLENEIKAALGVTPRIVWRAPNRLLVEVDRELTEEEEKRLGGIVRAHKPVYACDICGREFDEPTARADHRRACIMRAIERARTVEEKVDLIIRLLRGLVV